MRLFVALRPPPEALAHLEAALPQWPSAPERWHLTLAFLGEVDAPPDLTGVGDGPLTLQLRGSGVFGRGGPVWVGVAGELDRLTALAAGVASTCRRQGHEVERRPYRPHLTVGRRGHPDPSRLAAYEGPVWTATELELVRSSVGRTVEHVVLQRHVL